MELKTKVLAEEGRQDLIITREFELPVELLYRAYVEPDIVEQWMGTRVLKLENRPHGSWQFQTVNEAGIVVFGAQGVFHSLRPERQIVRTFEMDNAPFGVQLEFLDFEALGADSSRLRMQSIYQTAALRDAMLKLPFRQGLNMAHNRLQEIAGQLI